MPTFSPCVKKSLLFAALLIATSNSFADKKCLYISSYHQGYAWSDGVERGLREKLEDHCVIRQFDMDSKRNKDKTLIQQAAVEARQIITAWKPDVVITSDDNAAKYVIQQYYRDSDIPFVFCGVNWTADEYGFPYSNVTGIIEVAPLKAMLEHARDFSSSTNAVYLGANTLTETKNLERTQKTASRLGIKLEGKLVNHATEWREAYLSAQQAGFIVMGSFSGIEQWDMAEQSAFAIKNSPKLVVTSHDWMMPVSTIGFTKIPEEHGEWAALAAVEILAGLAPSDIPIVANRQWDLWINFDHLQETGVKLPRKFKRKAKKVSQ
jgi:ABC-type uncharacterized transport system substrate-binding protein